MRALALVSLLLPAAARADWADLAGLLQSPIAAETVPLTTSGVDGLTAIRIDTVAVTNGVDGFVDDFDDGVLDPAWMPLAGSPDREAGGSLELDAGDGLLRLTGGLPGSVVAAALVDVSDLPADGAGVMFLTCSSFNDIFALIFTPTATYAHDGASVIGSAPITLDTTAQVQFAVAEGGLAVAAVNGVPVYVGANPLGSPVGSVGFFAVPEPATAALLGGTALLLRRRRAA